MAKNPSRKAWRIDDAPKLESAKRSTLDGLAESKPKPTPFRGHELTSIGSLPKPLSGARPKPFSVSIELAVIETARFLGELRKSRQLENADVAKVLRSVQDLYLGLAVQDQTSQPVGDMADAQVAVGADAERPAMHPIDLPASAPEAWKARDLNMRENAPQFIRRVYAEWLGRGLERKDIARLDQDLYKALSVWLSRHPEDPIVADLPPQREKLDELIDELSSKYPLEDLRKLGHAIDARLRRKQK